MVKLSPAVFRSVPDPALLYLTDQHARALAYLQLAMRRAGCLATLIGEEGCGKTLLVSAAINDALTLNTMGRKTAGAGGFSSRRISVFDRRCGVVRDGPRDGPRDGGAADISLMTNRLPLTVTAWTLA